MRIGVMSDVREGKEQSPTEEKKTLFGIVSNTGKLRLTEQILTMSLVEG